MVELAQREAGVVASRIHQAVSKLITPGLNVLDIESLVKTMITEAKMEPAFLGFKGYPAVSCISVNSAIVHGIPEDRILNNGDVVTVDIGVKNKGWIVDTAVTHPVGVISNEAKKLLSITQFALNEAIKICRPGKTTGDIGAIIQKIVESAGFYIVKELTGHGVGRSLQEYPSVANFGTPGKGAVLKEGMSIAIEPITTLKSTSVKILDDGWTIASDPAVIAAHFEDTIYIDKNEPLILTKE